jgi:hypothetical protein
LSRLGISASKYICIAVIKWTHRILSGARISRENYLQKASWRQSKNHAPCSKYYIKVQRIRSRDIDTSRVWRSSVAICLVVLIVGSVGPVGKQPSGNGLRCETRINSRGANVAAALIMPICNTAAMNYHLCEISSQVAADAHAVVILDGAGWHRSQGLAVPGNITLLALPPYSPELNPVERIRHYLRSHWLANSVFRSLADIMDACEMAWNWSPPTPAWSARSARSPGLQLASAPTACACYRLASRNFRRSV